jgi:hypothetical protein
MHAYKILRRIAFVIRNSLIQRPRFVATIIICLQYSFLASSVYLFSFQKTFEVTQKIDLNRKLGSLNSLANKSGCIFQYAQTIDSVSTRNFYFCTRFTGSVYRDSEVITISLPNPTPIPTPAWVGLCEVDSPSLILDSTGQKFGTKVANRGQITQTATGTRIDFDNYSGPEKQILQFDFSGNQQKWTNATYVVPKLKNTGTKPMRITFIVTSDSAAYYSFIIGSGETAHLSLPLYKIPISNSLFRFRPNIPSSAQPWLTPISPLNGYVDGNIQRLVVVLDNTDPEWSRSMEVQSIEKNCRPFDNFNRAVDEFGQPTYLNMPNRVTSSSQLTADASLIDDGMRAVGATNIHGTPLTNPIISTPGTGFRFIKFENSWTMVDPSGRKTKLIGVNGPARGLGMGSLVDVDRRYDTNFQRLFTKLPGLTEPRSDAYMTVMSKYGHERTHYDHHIGNLILKYGTEWQSPANTRTAKRLKQWGFNSCDCDPVEYKNEGIRYVSWRNTYGPNFKKMNPSFGNLTDPFDSAFATEVNLIVASEKILQTNNPNLYIGFYSDNEFEWGNKNDSFNRWNVAITTLKSPANQPAKIYFTNQLTAQYDSINNLNSAWNTTYPSWPAFLNDLNTGITTVADIASEKMQTDFSTFTLSFGRAYYSAYRTAIVNNNYQGLYLGTRFRGNSYVDEIIQANQEYADAVSVNIYSANPSFSNPEFKLLDKPIIISEFSFSTPGPSTGKFGSYFEIPVTISTQQEVISSYFADLKDWKNVVGVQWWEYVDEGITGRFSDGENSSFGLVNVADRPYPELTQTLKGVLVDMERSW